MHGLREILLAAWRMRVDGFWVIWISMTGLAAIVTAWWVGSAASRETSRSVANRSVKPAPSGATSFAVALVILLLAGYIVASLQWEVFADYDDAYFTLFTLKGHDLAPTIWRASGRFFPLGHQEFNLIRHLTASDAGYHVMPIIEILVVAGLLLFLDDEISLTSRALLAAGVLILPSLVTSFTGLVFPDRNVIFWLVWLVFFVKRFDRTRSTACAIAAVICAQIMIYYKETAFLLLFGFAAGRLLLRCRRVDGDGWDFSRLREKESRLDVCLLLLAPLFLLYYLAAMLPHVNMGYDSQMRFPMAQVLLYYLRVDLLAWLFVGVFLARTYWIVRRRVEPSPLWDGLALGAVLCFAAYLDLRLCTPYYLAPVDLIAILYLGRIAALSWGHMPGWIRMAAAAVTFVVLAQGASLSAFRLFERKNLLHAKTELADRIVARSQVGSHHVQRIFFPFSEVYPLTEFASYLTFRGIHVEGEEQTAESAGRDSVVLVNLVPTKDGRCVDYRDFVCQVSSRPNPGDLVIELPDDLESLDAIKPYRNGGETLVSYHPWPSLPKWMAPVLGCLRAASVRFQFQDVPDRWLNASMTLWK